MQNSKYFNPLLVLSVTTNNQPDTPLWDNYILTHGGKPLRNGIQKSNDRKLLTFAQFKNK